MKLSGSIIIPSSLNSFFLPQVWNCPVQHSDQWGRLQIPLVEPLARYILEEKINKKGTLRMLARHLDLVENEEHSPNYENETISCFEIEMDIARVYK